jgi:hypothetical protein
VDCGVFGSAVATNGTGGAIQPSRAESKNILFKQHNGQRHIEAQHKNILTYQHQHTFPENIPPQTTSTNWIAQE